MATTSLPLKLPQRSVPMIQRYAMTPGVRGPWTEGQDLLCGQGARSPPRLSTTAAPRGATATRRGSGGILVAIAARSAEPRTSRPLKGNHGTRAPRPLQQPPCAGAAPPVGTMMMINQPEGDRKFKGQGHNGLAYYKVYYKTTGGFLGHYLLGPKL